MSKAPTVKADQFGAALDALIATNALLFTVIASRDQHEAALKLLGRVLQANEEDGLDPYRRHVMEATASHLQVLREMREGSGPVADE